MDALFQHMVVDIKIETTKSQPSEKEMLYNLCLDIIRATYQALLEIFWVISNSLMLPPIIASVIWKYQ